MTLGDAGLTREVLAMFSGPGRRPDRPSASDGCRRKLAGEIAPALAHTLKGSARAVGAFRVADAAEGLEVAIRKGDDPAEALAGLKEAVVEASTAIDVILRRS